MGNHVHNPKIGEIWSARFPYREGFGKNRPVLVVDYTDAGKVKVQKISTKPKFGSCPILHPDLGRPSYLHDSFAIIEPTMFRHKIWKPRKDKPMLLAVPIPFPDWWEKRGDEDIGNK